MKEELVKGKTIKLAMKVGYVLTTPNVESSFPTQSSLQKWLREVHKINVYCTPTHYNHDVWVNNVIAEIPVPVLMGSYEEVLEKGLQEALEIIQL